MPGAPGRGAAEAPESAASKAANPTVTIDVFSNVMPISIVPRIGELMAQLMTIGRVPEHNSGSQL